MNIGFQKVQRISWLANELLLAVQEGLRGVSLV